MVACNHAHLDAGAMALGDGYFGLGAGGIDDTDHGEGGEVRHQAEQIGFGIEGSGIEITAGDDHDALTFGGHAVVFVKGEVTIVVGDGENFAAREPVGATAGDEDVGGTFDEGADYGGALLVSHVVEGGHELVFGVEGDFGDAGVGGASAIKVYTTFGCEDDKGAFGGVTDEGTVTLEAGIGAEGHGE